MPEILSDDDAAATPEGNIVNKTLFPDKKGTTPGAVFQSIKTSSHSLPSGSVTEAGSGSSSANTPTLNLVNTERKFTPIIGPSVSVAQIKTFCDDLYAHLVVSNTPNILPAISREALDFMHRKLSSKINKSTRQPFIESSKFPNKEWIDFKTVEEGHALIQMLKKAFDVDK